MPAVERVIEKWVTSFFLLFSFSGRATTRLTEPGLCSVPSPFFLDLNGREKGDSCRLFCIFGATGGDQAISFSSSRGWRILFPLLRTSSCSRRDLPPFSLSYSRGKRKSRGRAVPSFSLFPRRYVGDPIFFYHAIKERFVEPGLPFGREVGIERTARNPSPFSVGRGFSPFLSEKLLFLP